MMADNFPGEDLHLNSRACGCTGIRTCLICHANDSNALGSSVSNMKWFCPQCQGYFSGGCFESMQRVNSMEFDVVDWCNFHELAELYETDFELSGVRVYLDFICAKEEQYLCECIDSECWKMSQSGRKKQDFGPKANFKRKKVKLGSFTGLPAYSQFLVRRFKDTVAQLNGFRPVELCNLHYHPDRGSAIDPHQDDSWLWGDELVTINLLSCTILTLTNPNQPGLEVHVPLPARSLVVISKDARYIWLHGIQRQHITKSRIAMTFRNLSSEFASDGELGLIGDELLRIAESYSGSVVK